MKKLLAALLFLLVAPAAAQVCNQTFTLYDTACPAWSSCNNNATTPITGAENDDNLLNILDLCEPFDDAGTALSILGDWTFKADVLIDNQKDLRFFEADGNGSNWLAFQAPAAVTTNQTCTLENDASFIPDSCVGDGTDSSFTPDADPGVNHGSYVAGHSDGGDCNAGEIPLGVDAAGAVVGCYEPVEADITDLDHIATGITNGLIVEEDLDADEVAVNNDILTFDDTGNNYSWQTPAELGLEGETHASEHQHSGGDEVATATPAANVIPKAGAGSTLADGFIDGSAEEDEITHDNLGSPRTATAGDSAASFFSSGEVEKDYLPNVESLDTSGGTDSYVLQQTGASTYEWDWPKARAHATDCTALTDGEANDFCWEIDANTWYVCEPSAGLCDTPAEWVAATAAGDGVGYDEIMEEGAGLTKRAQVNFIGSTITCVDNGGATRTDCTISAGGATTWDVTDTDASPILTVDDTEQVQFIGAGTVTIVAAADGSDHDVTITGSAHDGIGTDNQNLTVTAGGADTSVIDIEDGSDVTISGGTLTNVTEAASTITIEAVDTLSSYTDDLAHVEEGTTVTDNADGIDITLSTLDIEVALDPSEVANQAADLADLVLYEDVTDGGIHHMTLTQTQTLMDVTQDDLSDDDPTALQNVTTMTNGSYCQGNGNGFDCDVTQENIPSTDHIGAIGEIATALKSGTDGELITGTIAATNAVVAPDANDDLVEYASLVWNVVAATCTGDGNAGALTVNGTNQIICSPDDGGAGGSSISAGDSDVTVADAGAGTVTVTVDSSAVAVWDVGGLTVGGVDATDQVILPSSNDATTPTLAFGSGGDTGIYEISNGVLGFGFGTARYQMDVSYFKSLNTTGAGVKQSGASATVPTLQPANADIDSGIGQNAADQLSLIAGGVEGLRLTEATTVSAQLPSYGSGTITGTDAYWLAVDSSGNIIEEATPGGTGDVTAVGSCADGDCFTDGDATTGTTLMVWEGNVADAEQVTFAMSSVEPASAFTLTYPDETGTICSDGSVCSGYDPTGGDNLSDDNPTALQNVTTINDGDYCQGNASSGFECDVTTIPDADVDNNITIDHSTAGTLTLDADDPTTNEGQLGWDGTGNVLRIGEAGGTDYAAQGASDGAALAGDDAAGFFDAGTIEHERGGLEQDVNTWTGLLAIDSGTTTVEVDDKSELEAQLTDVADIAEADGDVYSGTHDFGTADDIEIVNNGNPTVDTAGQIAIDTTGKDQLTWFGSAQRTINYEHPLCARFEELSASDTNIELFMANNTITITGLSCHCAGTCSPTIATISLEDRAANAMTHGGSVTCGSGTGNSSYTAVTAANQLVVGESVVFDVDNTPNPATDDYLICLTYTDDEQ